MILHQGYWSEPNRPFFEDISHLSSPYVIQKFI